MTSSTSSLLALLVAGTVGIPLQAATTSELTWPAPPAEARIRYLHSIDTARDMGARRGILSRVWGWITGDDSSKGILRQPFALHTDYVGNLYFTDTGHGLIGMYEPAEEKFTWIEHPEMRTFRSPVALAKVGDRIFVADSAESTVIGLDLQGKPVLEITAPIGQPAGLAVHEGNLFVSDSRKHCIHVFTIFGRHLYSFGSRGAAEGQFNFPSFIAFSPDGLLFVNDTLNYRIQVFTAGGTYLRTWGRAGQASGSFNRPKGIAFDPDGNVYVVDAMFDNVQVFSQDGQLLLHWGDNGEEPGEFWLPSGIAINSRGKVFVADSYNKRIQVFQYLQEDGTRP